MPVEIRELVIKAVVGGDAEEEAAPGKLDVEEIVAACVREVLRVLDRDRER